MFRFYYPFKWCSSVLEVNHTDMELLQNKMRNYYSTRSVYYESDITGSENLWNTDHSCYSYIIKQAFQASSILELGCGKSSILNWFPELEKKYTGVEFSQSLVKANSDKYSKATFLFTDGKSYPVPDQSFDLVFSVFVIEHTVYPRLFLDECIRILKPGGSVIILAPNYRDYLWMASQQVASNIQTGTENLKIGKFLDAFTSFLYNKFLIPNRLKKIDPSRHGFWINLDPLCFHMNDFRPDVDAIYITSQREVESYLAINGFKIQPYTDDINNFCLNRRYLFIHGTKA